MSFFVAGTTGIQTPTAAISTISAGTLTTSATQPPLFFSIYENDRENLLQGRRVKLYADDTVMYHSGENRELV